MKRVIGACIALALGATYAASDSEFLLWMVESPDVVKDGVTMTFAGFSALNEVNSARVAVSGGDLSGDTYLNIYTTADGKTWTVSDSPYMEVTAAGLAGPIWSGLGAYGGESSVYSFTIELGNYDLTSDAWTVLARSETASYQKLRDEWSTNTSVLDVPGTIEWTGGAYTAVPEPSGGMLFLLGGMILALRRRRPAVSARASRPFVAVLALGLVFSSTAATLAENITTESGFSIEKKLMGSFVAPDWHYETASYTDLASALADTGDHWKQSGSFAVVAGYIGDSEKGDFNYDNWGGTGGPTDGGFPSGRFQWDGSTLFTCTATLVVPSAGKWTIALGAAQGSDFVLTIGQDGAAQTLTTSDYDETTRRAVKTFDFPTAGNYSFSLQLYRNTSGVAFIEFSCAKGEVVASEFSTETFKLVGKASADDPGTDDPDPDDPGTDDPSGDDPLLRDVVAISTNTFGMATIYSSDTNTIVAVPWTWYSKREEDAGPIFAEKLVSPENLSAGDFLVLLTDATGNATSKAAGYAAWTLDENLKWQPTATVACAPEGGLAHTTILAGSNDTVARGYGIWLLRTNPLNEDGTPKPFHVYGQFVSQGTTVTVKGGGTRTAPVFTMLADPYLREVKVNADIDWGSNPGSLDSLAIVTDQTTFQYCKWNGTQWWYSKVTYDEYKHMNVTERITDIRVPAGAGFWYVRRTGGDFSVTWGENK